MKWILLLLTISFSSTYAQYNSLNNIFVKEIIPPEGNFHAITNFSTKRSGASQNFNVHYYNCHWKVDPAVRFISGTVSIHFTMLNTDNFLKLDLSDSLTVDSIIQRNEKLNFEHTANVVKIFFKDNLPAAQNDSVKIYYKGVPPNDGFGSFTTSVQNGIPVLWTLSEPYGSRNWWPCKDGLRDKADSIDVYITAPSAYTGVSNGLRQADSDNGNEKTTHWKHRYPIASYLVCMAVTNYAEFENFVEIAGKDLLMQTFCYPANLNDFKINTPKVLEAMQYFSNLVGPYPFINEKYGHVQFGFGGGEEHQTSTFIYWPIESLMAHELAHQWFGDKVTCGSWRHIWLNEGFASFMASIYMEQKYPQTMIPNRKSEIELITSLPDGSVYVDDTTSVKRIFSNRLTYIKGSHLLYMLRWILGDEIFFKAIREYLEDPKLAFGFALTKDLQEHLESASGKDLNYFFNEWFYGQGYPGYHIDWWQQDDKTIGLRVSQQTSDASVSFFHLPLPLRLQNDDHQHDVTVNPVFNGQIFFIKSEFVPDTLLIDPDYLLITKGNRAAKIVTPEDNQEVKIYPNPVQHYLNIFFNGFPETNADFRLFNPNGQLVFRMNSLINGSLKSGIDMSRFSRGIYILKIKTEKGFHAVYKIEKR